MAHHFKETPAKRPRSHFPPCIPRARRDSSLSRRVEKYTQTEISVRPSNNYILYSIVIHNELRSVAISTCTNKFIFCFCFVSIGSAESQFYTTFPGNQLKLRLQSAKVETCFLLFNNSEFVGGVPSLTDNDLFEIVQLEFNMIALRVVNPMYSQQSGSGASAIEETHTEMANTKEVQAEEVANTEEESVVSECYLGFDSFGKPECYDSTDDRATKFLLIDLLY